MAALRILIHHGKQGDSFWLADTPTRAAQAREDLFNMLDEQGYYEVDEEELLEKARAGDEKAIEIILESRRGCEYEDWDYEYVEVPITDGAPGPSELVGFDTYQQAAHSLSCYPSESAAMYAGLGLTGEVGETVEKLGQMLEQVFVALKLAGSAGKVANQIKKIGRDDGGVPSEKRRAAILKELGDCLWYLAEVATTMGCNLSSVAHANMVNLFGRKERGTIKGDGDNR